MKPFSHHLPKSLALLAAFAVSFFSEARGQISVAPTTVIIEGRNPFGEFLVANRSNTPQEIAISFQFGFPVSDEAGETSMEYEDVEKGAPYDLSDRVRAFPRRFVLPPGEQQTVRLLIRPGRELPDGVYWTRLVTTSNPREQDVEAQQLREDVSARIIFQVRQVTTLIFKQGNVTTGVEVKRFEAHVEPDQVVVEAELEREGNAPFIGRSHLQILDAGGQSVFENEQNVSLYFDLFRRFTIPLEELAPGDYRAQLTLLAARRDIPRAELIPMEPVRKEAALRVPPRTAPDPADTPETIFPDALPDAAEATPAVEAQRAPIEESAAPSRSGEADTPETADERSEGARPDEFKEGPGEAAEDREEAGQPLPPEGADESSDGALDDSGETGESPRPEEPGESAEAGEDLRRVEESVPAETDEEIEDQPVIEEHESFPPPPVRRRRGPRRRMPPTKRRPRERGPLVRPLVARDGPSN